MFTASVDGFSFRESLRFVFMMLGWSGWIGRLVFTSLAHWF